MRMFILTGTFLVLSCPQPASAQLAEPRPRVVFQTGISDDAVSHFRFSPSNAYLYATNDLGEYLLWDMRNMRQIRKLGAPTMELPAVSYFPQADFSKDERYTLIPEFPKGNYQLYDLLLDSVIHRFVPVGSADGVRYTHARFSNDGRILLVAQTAGETSVCEFRIMDYAGKSLKSFSVNLPSFGGDANSLGRLLYKKDFQLMGIVSKIGKLITDAGFSTAYLTGADNRFYMLDLNAITDGSQKNLAGNETRAIAGNPALESLSITNDRIVLKRESVFKELKDGSQVVTDSFFVLNRSTLTVQRVSVSTYLSLPVGVRSNTISAELQTSNAEMSVYLDRGKTADGGELIVGRDMLTGKELFRIPRGVGNHWWNRHEYNAGEINGGTVIAISADGRYMLETSLDLVLHDLATKKIRSTFSSTRGQMKLSEPVFLDSGRILVPKNYNDGFVIDLKKGDVNRLKRGSDCQDTARNGANIYHLPDNNAQFGTQSSAYYPNENLVVVSNYLPNDLCTNGNNKTIELYDSRTVQLKKSYSYRTREFGWSFSKLPGTDNQFLVNHQLVKFDAGGKAQVSDLAVRQKKDSFFAIHPVYLPASGTIFAVMAQRMNTDNPDLLFAHFDLNGKIIKQVKIEGPKKAGKFAGAITNAVLSPDQTRLIYTNAEGAIGIFDVVQMKPVRSFNYGDTYKLRRTDLKISFYVFSLCFLNKDTYVTSGTDMKLQVWSMDSDKPLRELTLQEPGLYYSLVLSPDKRFIAGVDANKTLRFIEAGTGNIAASFAAFNYENYALVNAAGYYLTNKKAGNDLTFLYKGRGYDYSQFDLSYNRPDKVLESFNYASPVQLGYYRNAWTKRMQKMGLKGMPKFGTGPEISLADLPPDLTTTSAPTISFTVKGTDLKSAITRLFITVNGVPAYGVKGLALNKLKAGAITVPVKLPLTVGSNLIIVSAINSDGVESLQEFLTVRRQGVSPKADLYIITIGSGTFQQKGKDLKFAAKDATDVSNLFNEKAGMYGKINRLSLTGAQVTRANVFKLKQQLRSSKPEDMVVLFFAGHGILDKDLNYYLSTYAVDFEKPAAAGLSYEELESIVDSIPARNKLLLIDACHSGELDKESVTQKFDGRTSRGDLVFRNTGNGTGIAEKKIGLENSFNLMRSVFPDLRRSTGSSVIAAAAAAEYAVESDQWKNGVFTYSLQVGLKENKADLNKDGVIMLSELLEYIQVSVRELTNGNQQPVSRAENLATDLRIW